MFSFVTELQWMELL